MDSHTISLTPNQKIGLDVLGRAVERIQREVRIAVKKTGITLPENRLIALSENAVVQNLAQNYTPIILAKISPHSELTQEELHSILHGQEFPEFMKDSQGYLSTDKLNQLLKFMVKYSGNDMLINILNQKLISHIGSLANLKIPQDLVYPKEHYSDSKSNVGEGYAIPIVSKKEMKPLIKTIEEKLVKGETFNSKTLMTELGFGNFIDTYGSHNSVSKDTKIKRVQSKHITGEVSDLNFHLLNQPLTMISKQDKFSINFCLPILLNRTLAGELPTANVANFICAVEKAVIAYNEDLQEQMSDWIHNYWQEIPIKDSES